MNQNELRQPELFPHQVEFIETALKYAQGGRLLLADAVGLGKNQAVAALVRAMSSQRETNLRTLFVGPASLISLWSDQLARRGITGVVHVDQQEFRRLEARTEADQNPWTALETAVTSLDFVKNEEKLRSLVSAGWDLVIFDEAHVAHGPNQRGRLLQSLWESDQVQLMVAMSATPGSILHLQPPPDIVFDRGASDLHDLEGLQILPVAREIEVKQILLSSEEQHLLTSTIELLGPSDSAGHPISVIWQKDLLRRAASSLFAFAQSLDSLLLRASDGTSIFVGDGNSRAEFEVDPPIEVQLPISPTEARRLLGLIEHVSEDNKWSTCAQLLFEDQTGAMIAAVIFTDFVDTVDYIVDQLALYDPDLLVHGLSQDTAFLEGDSAVAGIRQTGGVLVVTSDASEGLDLSFVNLCLHYDVPPDARSLERRLGTLNRTTRILPFRQFAFADEIVSVETSMREKFESLRYLG